MRDVENVALGVHELELERALVRVTICKVAVLLVRIAEEDLEEIPRIAETTIPAFQNACGLALLDDLAIRVDDVIAVAILEELFLRDAVRVLKEAVGYNLRELLRALLLVVEPREGRAICNLLRAGFRHLLKPTLTEGLAEIADGKRSFLRIHQLDAGDHTGFRVLPADFPQLVDNKLLQEVLGVRLVAWAAEAEERVAQLIVSRAILAVNEHAEVVQGGHNIALHVLVPAEGRGKARTERLADIQLNSKRVADF